MLSGDKGSYCPNSLKSSSGLLRNCAGSEARRSHDVTAGEEENEGVFGGNRDKQIAALVAANELCNPTVSM